MSPKTSSPFSCLHGAVPRLSFAFESLEDRTLLAFTPVVELSSLDGLNGFTMNGVAANDQSRSVSGAGDVNGDGFGDVIIGAPFADPNINSEGQSYVVFGTGAGFPDTLELSSLDGSNGFTLNGTMPGDRSGCSVSGAGDVNGDGLDDLIIGAYGTGVADPGRAFVVFGTSAGFPATLELSSLDGSNGFAINGINNADRAGSSVSGAGDVNGDGLDDVIIGAPTAGPNGAYSGQSYVVFGSAGGFAPELELSSLDGSNGFAINGIATFDSASVVSGAGDVNGDGIDDVIVGAPYAGPNGALSGQSYVVFGSAGGFAAVLELSALDGSNGFSLNGIAADDRSGGSVSNAGDINGDGIDDLIIGAFYADPNGSNSGQSYVVFGNAGGFAAVVELSSLDGSNGFAINGIAAGDWSGSALSGTGDVNGDGLDDLIIGARQANPNGADSGQSYVVFGRADGFAAVLELSSMNGSNGITINGITAGDASGGSVSGAGDVNGDGIADLIVLSGGADPNGSGSGQSYVIFGQDDQLPTAVIGTAPAVNNASDRTRYEFTVVYADNGVIDVSSLGNGDILVTGPNGFSQLATFVSVTPGGNGTLRTATYFIVPPNGSWTDDANGAYTISVEPNQVLDGQGNAVAAGQIGTFEVFVLDGNSAFVWSLYRDLLHRTPDAEGLSGWVALLDGGASRELVASSIVESAEQRGLEVDLLYQGILGRTPSAEERASWVNAFLAGLSSEDAISSFLSSAEYLAAHPVPSDFLTSLYFGLLARAPDQPGFEAWTAFLETNSPSVVASSFIDSPEFSQIIIARYYGSYLDRAPDPTGSAGWGELLDSGALDFDGLAINILASDEYFALSSSTV